MRLCKSRTMFLLGMLITCFVSLPSDVQAQSNPLTIQPSTGNVGIGTTAPGAKLHVSNGGATIQNTGPALVLFDDATAAAGNKGALRFHARRSVDQTEEFLGYIQGISEDGQSNGGMRFVARSNTDIEAMRISSSGNVGIGTTSPTAKLAVYDGGDINPNLYVVAAGNTPTRVRFERLGASAPDFIITGSGTNVGLVGIGTVNPSSKLHVIGDITASGAKNFQIDHPLEPDKKHLVHSALEGPEAAVYYRGEAQLVNGEVVVTLPSYFEALTRKEQRTVQLTPIKGWAPLFLAEEIHDGKFTVQTANGNPSQRFYWEVKAVRGDVQPLVVEKLKENMKLAENVGDRK